MECPDIFIPSCRPSLAAEAKALLPEYAQIFDGTGMKCYSWMINACIVRSNTEVVIICNDRARPVPGQLDKLCGLLASGYGLVGLHRFGFYGFHKDLIRRIGFFDERFILGEFEDCDILRRMREAEIAYYESEEVSYLYVSSNFTEWNTMKAKEHFHKKWHHQEGLLARLLPEEQYDYDIGKDTGTTFLPWSASEFLDQSSSFLTVSYENRVP